jgi:hypothetical protein
MEAIFYVIFLFAFWIWLPLMTGRLAARKGYNFLLWTLGGGMIGLIILAFLPFANRSGQPIELQADLKRRANTIAGSLATVFAILITMKVFNLF